jgi:hypothetical protein
LVARFELGGSPAEYNVAVSIFAVFELVRFSAHEGASNPDLPPQVLCRSAVSRAWSPHSVTPSCRCALAQPHTTHTVHTLYTHCTCACMHRYTCTKAQAAANARHTTCMASPYSSHARPPARPPARIGGAAAAGGEARAARQLWCAQPARDALCLG